MPDDAVEPGSVAPSATDFGAILEAAVDAIVVIEADGRIVQFSKAAEAMFGYSADEIIGQPVHRLMPEPYRSNHAAYIDHYQSTGEARIMGVGRQVQAMRSNGEVFPVWLSVGESVTVAGQHFVGIVRDLTDERRAELERHSLEARLAHVSRLSLLGEMAAGIAHEINQPLSAITNYSTAVRNLLERGNYDAVTLKSACEGISEQVQRAGEVIRNLRKLARKHEIEKEGVSLDTLIAGVMGLVQADAGHAGIAVETAFAEGLPDVTGNVVQLQQVLLNLTRNAVDAMRQTVGRPKQMRIATARAADDTLEIRVSDRGPGVSPRLEDAIFHPFFTTKSEGLGVGLAISRSIVQTHGGALQYEDRPGGGSTFIVTLPILANSE
jgi:two-component system sensor kinase FixL